MTTVSGPMACSSSMTCPGTGRVSTGLGTKHPVGEPAGRAHLREGGSSPGGRGSMAEPQGRPPATGHRGPGQAGLCCRSQMCPPPPVSAGSGCLRQHRARSVPVHTQTPVHSDMTAPHACAHTDAPCVATRTLLCRPRRAHTGPGSGCTASPQETLGQPSTALSLRDRRADPRPWPWQVPVSYSGNCVGVDAAEHEAAGMGLAAVCGVFGGDSATETEDAPPPQNHTQNARHRPDLPGPREGDGSRTRVCGSIWAAPGPLQDPLEQSRPRGRPGPDPHCNCGAQHKGHSPCRPPGHSAVPSPPRPCPRPKPASGGLTDKASS